MRNHIAAMTLAASLASIGATACSTPPTAVAGATCAVNPTTGHIFATMGTQCARQPGDTVITVDVPCGPLTLATDDTCVRAVLLGKGAGYIVPVTSLVAGDVNQGYVE